MRRSCDPVKFWLFISRLYIYINMNLRPVNFHVLEGGMEVLGCS